MMTYEFSFDPSRFDIPAIHAYLTQSYWSPGIPLAVVQRAIAGSLCIGALQNGQQAAFARLVTDRATFAYLADVFVLAEHRGQGLSTSLLQRLFAHPDVQGLRRMMLATRDAHDIYRPFGFLPLAVPERFMERHVANVYAPTGE